MSGYAIVNLREDLEDMAPGFGLAPALEARFAREALGCGAMALSYQRLAPGARPPFDHRHERQEEVYVVLDGGGRVKVEDEIRDLRPLDAVRVAPGVTRAFEAGPDGLALLAIGAPYEGRNDAELVPGWWTG